jgi:apolipoprotein D and lipocalin family protein
MMFKRMLVIFTLLLSACQYTPEDITVVKGFQIEQYLGTWYEIARLDHSFERGLEKVTATYSLREDGGVKVVNRGFDPAKAEWKEARARTSASSGCLSSARSMVAITSSNWISLTTITS